MSTDTMANPVATILNPSKDRILVYYVTDAQQLGLDQLPIISNQNPLKYSRNGTPKGSFALAQSMCAVYLRGMPNVFGFLLRDDGKLVVAQLSPIVNYIKNPEEEKRLITDMPSFSGASNLENKAWFYYLSKPSANSDPQMIEAKLDYTNVGTRILQNIKPSAKSRVAALYLGGEVIVFYQVKEDSNNKIYWFKPLSNSSATAIDGTQNAKDGTPLGIVASPEGAAWLYYMDASGYLQRCSKPLGGSWSVTTSTMSPITDNQMANSSQLSVTQNVTYISPGDKVQSRTNNIFYMNYNDDYYSHHSDDKLD